MPFGFRVAELEFAASVCAAVVGWTLARRWLVSRQQQRHPSPGRAPNALDELADRLAHALDVDAVARAVEQTIKAAVPSEYVELEIALSEASKPPLSLPRNIRAHGAPEREKADQLSMPVQLGARRLATLHVYGKNVRQLSEADRQTLDDVARLASLALARAEACQALERGSSLRNLATRGEREALVETVAAEIAHEVRYPINFFRSIFERNAAEVIVNGEELDIGREEVQRLERLVAGLRRVAVRKLERRDVYVSELCARAEALLCEKLPCPKIELAVDPHAALRCDPHQVTQILVNLLTNAVEAAGSTGRVGIEFVMNSRGATLCVWDSGPGFSGNPENLFVPWYTTKLHGTGLGLAITQRLARAHGWNTSVARDGEHTVFSVTIPSSDVLADRTEPRADEQTSAAIAVNTEVAC